jgi:hypothetical protein
LAKSGLKVGQKWTKSGPKVDQKWTKSRPKVGQKWAKSGPKVDQKVSGEKTPSDPVCSARSSIEEDREEKERKTLNCRTITPYIRALPLCSTVILVHTIKCSRLSPFRQRALCNECQQLVVRSEGPAAEAASVHLWSYINILKDIVRVPL